MPFLLSKSIEFQELKSQSKAENEIIRKILADDRLEDIKPKNMSKKHMQIQLKPFTLIVAHMLRMDHANDPLFKESMETIRKMLPQMIAMLSGITMDLHQKHARGMSPKRLPARVMECIT